MKKFLSFIFFWLIVGGAGYFAYTTVKYVPEGQLLIVFDTNEDRVLYSCQEGWNIVPYTVIPGRVQLYPVDTTGSFTISFQLPIPDLVVLDDPLYSIRYGVSVDYELETESFNPTKSFLSDPEQIIQTAVSMYARNAFTELLSTYVTGEFQPERIKNDWYEIKGSLYSRIESGGARNGVKISGISEQEVLKIPDENMYQYGVSLKDDLLMLRKKHALEYEDVQHALNIKDLETGKYYEKLQKISDLISANPDLLKYMYIEKLGSNVQVVLPQGVTGYPFGLDKKEEEKMIVPESNEEDIDNLK